ncbi:MAG: hypothetical protein RBR40_00260 [Tenuifilaceae bacterium]|nr:hypothetical protein [Tenuifilaceae bacterium]
MRRTLILLLVLAACQLYSVSSFASNPEKKRRVSITLGVYEVAAEKKGSQTLADGTLAETSLPEAAPVIKVDYEFLSNFKVGTYLAYSTMSHKAMPRGVHTNSNTLFYGLAARYDVLPIITGKDNLRFEFCANAKLGVVSAKWTEGDGENWGESWNGPFPEYGVGLSAGFFFTKWLGLNLGYSAGRFYNNDISRWSAGIVFKI